MDYDGSWNARLNRLPKPLRAVIRGLYSRSRTNYKPFPEHVRYLELTERLPFSDDTVDGIYASHVWEHLYYSDAVKLTAECCRVLKPGGYLRVVVPNLKYYVSQYISNPRSDAANTLNKNLMFRETGRANSAITRIYTALTDFHSHKFMYDVPALVELLQRVGFQKVSERICFDSEIKEVNEIESPGRCSPEAGFAIEGQKFDRALGPADHITGPS